MDNELHAIARHFGLDETLLTAVERAEGNIVRAVQCSIPSVGTRGEALEITARSAVHALSDFIKAGGPERRAEFVAFWGQRWAPRGAANDPRNLNDHWVGNVKKLWV